MLRRRLAALLLLLVLLVGLWMGASGLVVWKLTRRPFPPFAEPAPNVSWGRVADVRLQTRDGQDIGGWLVEGRPGRPSVVLLHGNGSSRSRGLGTLRRVAGEGLTVLSLSLRCHGDSTGDVHDLGWSAREDVVSAVEFLRQADPYRPVVIFGRSLGAAAALFAAPELGDRVGGYFLESPFADLDGAVRHRLGLYLPRPLDAVAHSGMQLWAPHLLPVPLERIRPLDAIGMIPESVPVVLLSGLEDARATPEELRLLHDRVRAHATLLEFPDAAHGELMARDPERYHRAFRDLIARVGRG